MSHDTQVKQDGTAPDRIWLQPGQALDAAERTLSHVGTERVTEQDVEYVRAALLAVNYEYAVRLATVMWRHLYPDNQEWQPLETLSGVLSQIDNMIAGLIKTKPARSFKIQEPTGPF